MSYADDRIIIQSTDDKLQKTTHRLDPRDAQRIGNVRPRPVNPITQPGVKAYSNLLNTMAFLGKEPIITEFQIFSL